MYCTQSLFTSDNRQPNSWLLSGHLRLLGDFYYQWRKTTWSSATSKFCTSSAKIFIVWCVHWIDFFFLFFNQTCWSKWHTSRKSSGWLNMPQNDFIIIITGYTKLKYWGKDINYQQYLSSLNEVYAVLLVLNLQNVLLLNIFHLL